MKYYDFENENGWLAPEQVLAFVKAARGDCEYIWYAIANGHVYIAIEPEEPGDRAIAMRLGLHLVRHLDHPELPWIQIYCNINEET